jgi:short-subunit dehydrogenase
MKINILPMAILTRLFLETMNARKHRSGIINVGSGSAMTYYAGSAHYSATKKFVDFFSQSVGYECSDKVDFLLARPYIVTTTMTHNVETFYTTTVDKCTKTIVDSLGTKDYCYGPFMHNLQGVGSEFFHQELTSRAFTRTITHFAKLYNAAPK